MQIRAAHRWGAGRLLATALVALGLPFVPLVLAAEPAAAHAGDGNPSATHICVDSDNMFHLAPDDATAQCPSGQRAMHLNSTPITGPVAPPTTVPGSNGGNGANGSGGNGI